MPQRAALSVAAARAMGQRHHRTCKGATWHWHPHPRDGGAAACLPVQPPPGFGYTTCLLIGGNLIQAPGVGAPDGSDDNYGKLL